MATAPLLPETSRVSIGSRHSIGSFDFDDGEGVSPTLRGGQWLKQRLKRSHKSPWLVWALPLLAFGLGVALSAFLISTRAISLVELGFQPASADEARAEAGRVRMEALRGTDALPRHIANNLALTHDECDAGFPLFWPEVERTKAQFAERGIRIEDIELVERHNGARVAFVDGQLYIKRHHRERKTRDEAVIASLYQALVTSPEPIPDFEFWFKATDIFEPGPAFVLDKRSGEANWLMPDFGLWSWPEPGLRGWPDYRRRVAAVESRVPWPAKENKLFFRGNAGLAPMRQSLISLGQQHPEWADVSDLNWGTQAELVAMEEHCTRKWLASVEAVHAYSGRLKYLLQCHSVVVSHRMQFTQHFHGALVPDGPGQNIVELPDLGWDALPEMMDRLQSDEPWARNIADNAIRTMRDRYLTPAATTCYWRRVLREYAALQRFTPEIGNGADYESFAMLFRTEWRPYKRSERDL